MASSGSSSRAWRGVPTRAAASTARRRWPIESSRTERWERSPRPHARELLAPSLPGLAAEPADEVEDLAQRRVRGQVGLLGDIGEPPPRRHLRARVAPEIVAVDLDPARIRPLDSRRQLQERALAAAVGSQQQRQPGSESQVHTVQDRLGVAV